MKTNLYWAQELNTKYNKAIAVSPIFTNQKDFNEWKKEHKDKKYMLCAERNFFNSNIGMSR